jgi:hypothetical protein
VLQVHRDLGEQVCDTEVPEIQQFGALLVAERTGEQQLRAPPVEPDELENPALDRPHAISLQYFQGTNAVGLPETASTDPFSIAAHWRSTRRPGHRGRGPTMREIPSFNCSALKFSNKRSGSPLRRR